MHFLKRDISTKEVIVIRKSKRENAVAKQEALYDKTKKEEIEQGVTRMIPPKDPRGFEHGDIYVYQLREMTDEAIERYGLTDVYRGLKRRDESTEV